MKWVTYQRRWEETRERGRGKGREREREREREKERERERGGCVFTGDSAARQWNHPLIREDSHIQLTRESSGELKVSEVIEHNSRRIHKLFAAKTEFLSLTLSNSFLLPLIPLTFLSPPSSPFLPPTLFPLRRWGICPWWPTLLIKLYAADLEYDHSKLCLFYWYLGSGENTFSKPKRFGDASTQHTKVREAQIVLRLKNQQLRAKLNLSHTVQRIVVIAREDTFENKQLFLHWLWIFEKE